MFIHWGAYSVASRREWIMNRERIPMDEYTRLYVDNFQAENYDPDQWAEQTKRWGFGYVVLTARHHDGFALWDSQVNHFNAVRLGPKRDLIALYVNAMRKAGLKVGLYYSPANWTHPDFETLESIIIDDIEEPRQYFWNAFLDNVPYISDEIQESLDDGERQFFDMEGQRSNIGTGMLNSGLSRQQRSSFVRHSAMNLENLAEQIKKRHMSKFALQSLVKLQAQLRGSGEVDTKEK